MGKLKLVQSFCCKLHEVNQMFVVDYVGVITSKSPVSKVNMDCLSICSCCFFQFAPILCQLYSAFISLPQKNITTFLCEKRWPFVLVHVSMYG